MEEEDDDNMYAPVENTDSKDRIANAPVKEGRNDDEDGEEEGEEVEEDESDSVGAGATSCLLKA